MNQIHRKGDASFGFTKGSQDRDATSRDAGENEYICLKFRNSLASQLAARRLFIIDEYMHKSSIPTLENKISIPIDTRYHEI